MAIIKSLHTRKSPKRKREQVGGGQLAEASPILGGIKKAKFGEAQKVKTTKLIKSKFKGTRHDSNGKTQKTFQSSSSKSVSYAGEGKTDNSKGITPRPPFKKGGVGEKVTDRKARKERAEHHKKMRKPNYELEMDVKVLWEKTRQRNLDPKERSKLVSKILERMKGKVVEMSSSHISSRVVQTCIKYCEEGERDAVYEELRPHTLALTRNNYAYHIIIRLLDHANKSQLQQTISTLHGNIVSLLRHPVGSAVVEHAYQLANGAQKREMVAEFYSPEYRLFKGIMTAGKGGLLDIMTKEIPSKRQTMLQHMMLSLQPILEKGIIDHTITHHALVDYLSVSRKSMVEDVVQHLGSPLLLRMIHSKDGAKVGVTCIHHSTNKERKNIIRGMKGHVLKIAQDEYSSMVLLAILDVVDDTKIVSKVIISELLKELQDLACHKYGRRALLHLLAPRTPRYFPPELLAALHRQEVQEDDLVESQLESLTGKTDSEVLEKGAIIKSRVRSTKRNREKAGKEKSDSVEEGLVEEEEYEDENSDKGARGLSKKDPLVRRTELLSSVGLAKSLANVCLEHCDELLRSPLGTDVIYEVAMGGADGVLWQVAPDEVLAVHKAIADVASAPPAIDTEEEKFEHVFQQYHSSRTIRRLLLNAECPPQLPTFAATLWSSALKGKCKNWAQGHSAKVVSALRICRDETIKDASCPELQALVDAGLLVQSGGK